MNKTTIITAVLAAAFILTGCTSAGQTTTPITESEAPVVVTPPPTEEKRTTMSFGETYAYDIGVTMTVGAPEEFTPGPYAAGADQAHNLLFTLTIENNSTDNLDPIVFSRVSSAGVEASAIFDMDNALNGSPQTVILPGGSVTWKEAYSVADPAAIVFQTAPNYDYIDLVFTNTQ